MTFQEIEQVIGQPLPPSKIYPAWWSNNPSNNVMTRAWLMAGYKTERVDIGGERVVFRRTCEMTSLPSKEASKIETDQERPRKRHPIFGLLRGALTIAPDVDLTEPADPEWGKVAE